MSDTFETRLATYRIEVERELIDNILAFYINRTLDPINGGFYGLISNDLTVDLDAPKGLIQVTRILWAFAQAYRILGNHTYQLTDDRRFLDQSLMSWHFVKQTLIDRPEGDPGVAREAREWFWGVTRDGKPRNQQRTGP